MGHPTLLICRELLMVKSRIAMRSAFFSAVASNSIARRHCGGAFLKHPQHGSILVPIIAEKSVRCVPPTGEKL